MRHDSAVRSAFFRLALGIGALAAGLHAEGLNGRWDAVTTIGGVRIPFLLHFDGQGAAFKAAVSRGEARTAAAASSFDGKTLRAAFGETGSRLEATLSDGELKGVFGNEKTGMHAFQAAAFCTCGFVGEAGPDISGSWNVPESGWRLDVKRVGDDTIAAVQRGGGTSGPLLGRFNGVFFELSYFDGREGMVLEIEPRKDGGLDLSWMEPGTKVKKVTALRISKR